MTQLTPHFALEDFLRSEVAARLGIDMRAPLEIRDNLTALCTNVLEPLRASLGYPIMVTSGYRPIALNRAIGSADDSQHVRGQAADIQVASIEAADLQGRIRALGLPVDQCINEFGAWVHVSYAVGRPQRRQYLRAERRGGRVIYEALQSFRVGGDE